jgi:hypothetical protein
MVKLRAQRLFLCRRNSVDQLLDGERLPLLTLGMCSAQLPQRGDAPIAFQHAAINGHQRRLEASFIMRQAVEQGLEFG